LAVWAAAAAIRGGKLFPAAGAKQDEERIRIEQGKRGINVLNTTRGGGKKGGPAKYFLSEDSRRSGYVGKKREKRPIP